MNQKDILSIKAIDVHSHVGETTREIVTPEGLTEFHTKTEYLQKNMGLARIGISINSSFYALMPRGFGDADAANRMVLETIDTLEPGICWWATVNPLQAGSYETAAELLQHPRCMGIKVHPEEHLYPIVEHGEAIYAFAARQKAVIITHSGEANSLPEDFCTFANRYPEVTTITSHLGCGYDGRRDHQVRAIEANLHGNLFTDTSSAKSIGDGLLEWAVARIGSERILFGTDSGCYFSPCQRARVDYAHISDADKENILYRNALRMIPKVKAIYDYL